MKEIQQTKGAEGSVLPFRVLWDCLLRATRLPILKKVIAAARDCGTHALEYFGVAKVRKYAVEEG